MGHHSLDSCLHVLSDGHRRQVIRELKDRPGGAITFDHLVETLHRGTVRSHGSDVGDREELAIELHHTHLPQLADEGVLEYDRNTGMIRYQPVERVEAVLDALPEEETPLRH